MKDYHGKGTKEWAPKTINFIRGCQHNCLYCWAKCLAICDGRCTAAQWDVEVVNHYKLNSPVPKESDLRMFPSTHDITPGHLTESILFLGKLLEAYPGVLVVSKPHLVCIEEICKRFRKYRDKITFRFTIGSADNDTLGYWEPGAPSLSERIACLKYAFEHGFQTSVSCEPMLDDNIDEVVRISEPFVNETIWIGKANDLVERLKTNGHDNPEVMARAMQLLAWQSDDSIIDMVERLKYNPKIRWKESIRLVLP
ncbi:MAG: hypothetical protein KJ620_00980 [Candidatus Edwardsbacteria bacterium]|nr:hypothetical protein [Candidatus Edwardsbacteria bacterium]MBU2463527.1 hypothetical protein [Candidatus Edwardsbacteria bacterium]MBU2595154.1 hypothetical protein [Candidatus Edwardsbacteria bacterium]